ncbi:hypothetical protein MBRA1_001456 [Malassezia brasiliensis]|uniref:Uncharacterized protein n=1 Tax=Malassezia brasiliensis TaxID=1821822 RepID=A0AAF0DRJ4_9BASI|nr:hypothetical protein MBRA1_001456 [Malassezia brasiliensis]
MAGASARVGEDVEQRSNLIKLAADGYLDSHLVDRKVRLNQAEIRGHDALAASTETQTHIALTAQNLDQIPEAEQLAPGIRLPEHVISSVPPVAGSSCSTQGTDEASPGELAGDLEPSVPPELDPRTPVFRPGHPSAGSVFSVAVQPGSPRSVATMEMDRGPERPLRAASSVDVSMQTSSDRDPSSSRATTPVNSGRDSGSVAPNTQDTSRPESLADSEAGSLLSNTSHTAFSAEVREQELAIEQQRMREREQDGGELGIGGPIAVPFARLPDHLVQLRGSQSHHSMSSAATAASSPAASVREYDQEAPGSPTRGSVWGPCEEAADPPRP